MPFMLARSCLLELKPGDAPHVARFANLMGEHPLPYLRESAGQSFCALDVPVLAQREVPQDDGSSHHVLAQVPVLPRPVVRVLARAAVVIEVVVHGDHAAVDLQHHLAGPARAEDADVAAAFFDDVECPVDEARVHVVERAHTVAQPDVGGIASRHPSLGSRWRVAAPDISHDAPPGHVPVGERKEFGALQVDEHIDHLR